MIRASGRCSRMRWPTALERWVLPRPVPPQRKSTLTRRPVRLEMAIAIAWATSLEGPMMNWSKVYRADSPADAAPAAAPTGALTGTDAVRAATDGAGAFSGDVLGCDGAGGDDEVAEDGCAGGAGARGGRGGGESRGRAAPR